MNDIPKPKRGPKPKNSAQITETSVTNRMDDDTDPAPRVSKRGVIPPCPPSDPSMGMKTPDVVAWWFQYYPEEAKAKYAGLKLPEA